MDVEIRGDGNGASLEYNVIGGIFDFYFLAGSETDPAEVSSQYAHIAGTPAEVPYWPFGLHQCRYGYKGSFLFLFVLWLRLCVATSTEVERVFSQGRQLLSFTHNRLTPSSIRAYMCLGSWGRCDLLLMGDFLSALRAKKKQ